LKEPYGVTSQKTPFFIFVCVLFKNAVSRNISVCDPQTHHFNLVGQKRNVYRLLVGKPSGKTPLGRPRRRWIDNIKMNLLETGVSVVDWIGLAQDRYRWRALVNSVTNLRVP
jgi:hypothetical protein